jgi:hypothetical protein
VKCRIRLFSFLVSIIWIVSFAETKTLYLPLVLRLQDKMVCYLKRFGTPLFLESTLRILVILLRFLFDHNLRRSPYFPPLKSSNHPLKLQSCVNVFCSSIALSKPASSRLNLSLRIKAVKSMETKSIVQFKCFCSWHFFPLVYRSTLSNNCNP